MITLLTYVLSIIVSVICSLIIGHYFLLNETSKYKQLLLDMHNDEVKPLYEVLKTYKPVIEELQSDLQKLEDEIDLLYSEQPKRESFDITSEIITRPKN